MNMPIIHPHPEDIVPPLASGAGRPIAGNRMRSVILVDDSESWAVRHAASNLAHDMCEVTGSLKAAVCVFDGSPQTAGKLEAANRIVVGTIGTSPAVDDLIACGRLDVRPLRSPGMRETGVGPRFRFESFTIQAVGGILVIAGADRRGTVYGVYSLCEAMGVSPLHWWADVPARHRETVTVPENLAVFDWPAVRYRGFFINDEEELDDWAKAHTKDGTIGPATYRHVFDLILRLRGNYLWPAMHVNAFNNDPENGRLANLYGVVVGTSHCDMLLRSNLHEWGPWLARQREAGRGVSYDYSIPGHNREMIREYWRESVEANKNYEVTWTLGMRGIHDSGFVTKRIDEDPHLDAGQKRRAKVRLLGQVIADQRHILHSVLGSKAERAPQVFVPYKEVLGLYDAGLKVPGDVTLVWANDNYGYIRRLPNPAERRRSGGNGLYYHSSYWAPLTTSYRCTSSTALPLMRSELAKAWEGGIRRLWVDNLGAIKRLELEGSYFLHLAWNAGRDDKHCLPARTWLAGWMDRTFTGRHGKEFSDIAIRYYQVNSQTKIEHLFENAFPCGPGNNEAERRLEEIRQLFTRTNTLMESLPQKERDPFFEAFALKIHMLYAVSGQYICADRNRLEADNGQADQAEQDYAASRLFELLRRACIRFYNQQIAGGKWNRIFHPDDFPPPSLPRHPALRPLTPQAIHVSGAQAHPEGHTELDGERLHNFVCMKPDGYASNSGWQPVPDLSQFGGPALQAPATHTAQATVSYKFQLKTPGAHILEIHRIPTLDSVGRIRVGVSVDSLPQTVVESPTTDEWRGTWRNSIVRNNECLRLHLPWLEAGVHTLTLDAIDPYFCFQKLVIYTNPADPLHTVLGPESSRSRRESRGIIWCETVPAKKLTDKKAALTQTRVKAVRKQIFETVSRIYRMDPHQPQKWDVPIFPRRFWIERDAYPVTRQRLPEGNYLHTQSSTPTGSKPTTLTHPSLPVEKHGTVSWQAVTALSQTKYAWTSNAAISLPFTPDCTQTGLPLTWSPQASQNQGQPAGKWKITDALTDFGQDLAIRVEPAGARWNSPLTAPSATYRFRITREGNYHLWLLLKFCSTYDDATMIAVDGKPIAPDLMCAKGYDLRTFQTEGDWEWMEMCDIPLTPGVHQLSLITVKSGMRFDRILLTTEKNPFIQTQKKNGRKHGDKAAR